MAFYGVFLTMYNTQNINIVVILIQTYIFHDNKIHMYKVLYSKFVVKFGHNNWNNRRFNNAYLIQLVN